MGKKLPLDSTAEELSMCTNSSNGEHNYVLQSITVDGHVVVRRVCLLCNQEG